MATLSSAGEPETAPRPARVWFDALHQGLAEIEVALPQIATAADAAAEALLDGAELGVRGDRGLALGLADRAGSMWQYLGGSGRAADVILWAPEQGASPPEARVVIALGGEPAAMPETVHALPLPEDTNLPGLRSVLRRALAWTLQCEIFAACVRRGETPVVRQSLLIDTRRDRLLRYGSQRFHHDRYLAPIPAEELGLRYLQGLRDVLRDFETGSGGAFMAAARRVRLAHRRGGTAWLRTADHGLAWHTGGALPEDPDLLSPLLEDLSTSRTSRWRGGANDVVVLLGDRQRPGGDGFGNVDALREAGLGVIWIVSARPSDRFRLPRRDVLVDLWGPLGDGVVRVDHYDATLGPVSGVLAQSVYWMLCLEVAAGEDG
jgi:hypothetical protein